MRFLWASIPVAIILSSCSPSVPGEKELINAFPQSRLSALARQAAVEVRKRIHEGKGLMDLPSIVPQGLDGETCTGIAVRLIHDSHDRGCFTYWKGVTNPELAVVAIADSAAADARYTPISEDELALLRIEVTAFGKFKKRSGPFDFAAGRETLMIIHEKDPTLIQSGVYIDRHFDKQRFVEAICRKGKLPGDAWKDRANEWYAAPTTRIVMSFSEAERPAP